MQWNLLSIYTHTVDVSCQNVSINTACASYTACTVQYIYTYTAHSLHKCKCVCMPSFVKQPITSAEGLSHPFLADLYIRRIHVIVSHAISTIYTSLIHHIIYIPITDVMA